MRLAVVAAAVAVAAATATAAAAAAAATDTAASAAANTASAAAVAAARCAVDVVRLRADVMHTVEVAQHREDAVQHEIGDAELLVLLEDVRLGVDEDLDERLHLAPQQRQQRPQQRVRRHLLVDALRLEVGLVEEPQVGRRQRARQLRREQRRNDVVERKDVSHLQGGGTPL